LLIYNNGVNAFISNEESGFLKFQTAGAERAQIDASGRLLVGTSSSASGSITQYARVQVLGNSASSTGVLNIGVSAAASSLGSGADVGYIVFSDNSSGQYAHIKCITDGVSSSSSDTPGALVFSVTADGSSSPVSRIELKNDGTTRFNGAITSYLDNTQNIGSAAIRWSTVYAATGTINTSDENLKQDIEELNVAENSAASTVKSLIKKFRFKDAVIKKGDDARIHVGVIAQEVEQVFVDAGLDPRRYALFCEDELEDGTKRLGIRYDELLAFVIAAL